MGQKRLSFRLLQRHWLRFQPLRRSYFCQGDMGKFIKPIPLVITVALLASMVMSLTIVPIFREWHEKRHKHKTGKSRKASGSFRKTNSGFESFILWIK